MKIKYLGTAAAEGVPALFCRCEICEKARLLGGRNIRTRSQALVNDDLLLDFPPDSFLHLLKYEMYFTSLSNCLITHAHEDHFYPLDLQYLKKDFAHVENYSGLTVYGSTDLKKSLTPIIKDLNGRLTYVPVKPFSPFKVGKYTVTALKATHGTKHPFIYVIDQDGKKMLYAHDTDYFPEETWKYLVENKIYLSLVSMDCTEGNRDKMDYCGHMFFGSNKIVRDKLKELKIIDDNSLLVLNHFSHNGKKSNYSDFAPVAEKEGFLVSYDGMEIEF